ncbi:MAG: hypothetical protein MZV64_60470 [Ignavibacteriales bacterium]|nr:hypothetical protein [Ignavibacteriales bacterium]
MELWNLFLDPILPQNRQRILARCRIRKGRTRRDRLKRIPDHVRQDQADHLRLRRARQPLSLARSNWRRRVLISSMRAPHESRSDVSVCRVLQRDVRRGHQTPSRRLRSGRPACRLRLEQRQIPGRLRPRGAESRVWDRVPAQDRQETGFGRRKRRVC